MLTFFSCALGYWFALSSPIGLASVPDELEIVGEDVPENAEQVTPVEGPAASASPTLTPAPQAAAPTPTPTPNFKEIAREILPMENMREDAAARISERNYADQFDRFLHGKLGTFQRVTLLRSCKPRRTANPFCSLLRQARTLERYIGDKYEVHQPPTVAVPEPLLAEVQNNKILNFAQIKKSKIPALLKGLKGKSLADLKVIADAALAEKRCPNPLAVALAATMEDSMPDAALHEPIATLYEKGGDCARKEPVDREHLLTRAGLFYYLAKNYVVAEKVFARVRPNDAFAGRSLYWLGRVRDKQGNLAGSEKAFNTLLRRYPFSFHALVTNFEKKNDPAARYLVSKPITLSTRSRSRRMKETVLQIEILRKYGYGDSSGLVAGWALSRNWRLSAPERLFLTSFADPNTMVQTMPWLLLRRQDLISRQSMELWYPSKFMKEIEKNGNGADPYLLLAIAKKESAFDPRAISIAKAQGLMQLNPETAAKIDPESVPKLLEVDTNIQMGSRYVNQLMKDFNGNVALVIAAYNAGADPVFRWRKRYPTDEPILFLDLIPYRETREYVGYVLSNYYWYRRLYQSTVPAPDVNNFWGREPSNTSAHSEQVNLPETQREP